MRTRLLAGAVYTKFSHYPNVIVQRARTLAKTGCVYYTSSTRRNASAPPTGREHCWVWTENDGDGTNTKQARASNEKRCKHCDRSVRVGWWRWVWTLGMCIQHHGNHGSCVRDGAGAHKQEFVLIYWLCMCVCTLEGCGGWPGRYEYMELMFWLYSLIPKSSDLIQESRMIGCQLNQKDLKTTFVKLNLFLLNMQVSCLI